MTQQPIYTNDERFVFRRLRKFHGIDPRLAGERLHEIKQRAGRAPDDDVLFDLTGNVFDPSTRAKLGSLTEGGK